MTPRRASVLLFLGAAICLLGGMFGSAAASADDNGKVQLSVGGRAFTSKPTGPLLDTTGLAPGIAVDATLGVRSKFGVATDLSLRLINVHDDDNGCAPPEATVDNTCGTGQGDLGNALVFTVESATAKDGQYNVVWRGTAAQLVRGSAVGMTLPGNADRWLRLTASVPSAVGNIVESDTFRFGLRVVLQGNGVSGGSGVAGEQTGRPGSSSGVGGLATTGFATVLFVIGGVLLIAAGTVLLSAARGQRRRVR